MHCDLDTGVSVLNTQGTLSIVAPYSPCASQKHLQYQTAAYAADEAHYRLAMAFAVAVLKGLVAVCW